MSKCYKIPALGLELFYVKNLFALTKYLNKI